MIYETRFVKPDSHFPLVGDFWLSFVLCIFEMMSWRSDPLYLVWWAFRSETVIPHFRHEKAEATITNNSCNFPLRISLSIEYMCVTPGFTRHFFPTWCKYWLMNNIMFCCSDSHPLWSPFCQKLCYTHEFHENAITFQKVETGRNGSAPRRTQGKWWPDLLWERSSRNVRTL